MSACCACRVCSYPNVLYASMCAHARTAGIPTIRILAEVKDIATRAYPRGRPPMNHAQTALPDHSQYGRHQHWHASASIAARPCASRGLSSHTFFSPFPTPPRTRPPRRPSRASCAAEERAMNGVRAGAGVRSVRVLDDQGGTAPGLGRRVVYTADDDVFRARVPRSARLCGLNGWCAHGRFEF
jgi:hypothetical protein